MKKPLFSLLFMIFIIKPLAASSSIPPEHREILIENRREVVNILENNIIPYWYPKVIDPNGGYSLNHDFEGQILEPTNKALVTQARTLWFFSRLSRASSSKPEILNAAKHGFNFLIKSMKDQKNEGYYWEVSSSGDFVTKPDKHLYGQAFALYALSEYALASGDPIALKEAEELFNTIHTKSYDNENKGFNESFTKNWKPTSKIKKTYLGVTSEFKLMNTHLHIMEAITTYYQATKDPKALKILQELIIIHSDTMVHDTLPFTTDKFQKNWKRLTGEKYDRVSYGHDLENIWLLRKALEVTNQPTKPFIPLFKDIFAYAKKYGFDAHAGGYYNGGKFNAIADKREKVWWVQAETLVSALTMYQLTGEKQYLDNYVKTLGWIKKHQVDWKIGDWHQTIDESGKAKGNKASSWKSPYHNGRAMLESIRITDSLLSLPPTTH